MAEDLKMIRKIKKIMCNTKIDVNERLFTGEYVGNFAIRYVAYLLSKRAEKLDASSKRKLAEVEE